MKQSIGFITVSRGGQWRSNLGNRITLNRVKRLCTSKDFRRVFGMSHESYQKLQVSRSEYIYGKVG